GEWLAREVLRGRWKNERVATPVEVEINGPDGTPRTVRSADAHADLVASLRRAVDGEVSDSTLRRAEYSSDASNYRVVPQVVVVPKDVDDALAAITVTREAGVPLT